MFFFCVEMGDLRLHLRHFLKNGCPRKWKWLEEGTCRPELASLGNQRAIGADDIFSSTADSQRQSAEEAAEMFGRRLVVASLGALAKSGCGSSPHPRHPDGDGQQGPSGERSGGDPSLHQTSSAS